MTTTNNDGDGSPLSLAEIEAELDKFGPSLTREFHRARASLEAAFSDEALTTWARRGLTVAHLSFRSWESSAEYFRVSPGVLGLLGPTHFDMWAQTGVDLAKQSADLSHAYFQASLSILPVLYPIEIGPWAGLARRLYRGTQKSGALAALFLHLSPTLLTSLRLQHLDGFVTFLGDLSARSPELAQDCLTSAGEVFSAVEERDFLPLLSLLGATTASNWKYAKDAFLACASALPSVEQNERRQFLLYAETLAQGSGKRFMTYLVEGSRALGRVDRGLHHTVLDMFGIVLPFSQTAAIEFLRNSPSVLRRVKMRALDHWFLEGVDVLQQNEARGISFFKLESTRGERLLDALSSSVSLGEIQDILQMYLRALTGAEIAVKPAADLARKNIGWVSEERASTDGSAIFLPMEVGQSSSKERNFQWFKVLATHQAGHLEYESFAFSLERPAALFPNRRPRLARLHKARPSKGLSDFERFFDLFPDRRLVADIFTAVEDARVDHRIKLDYLGLRSPYSRVQQEALGGRPDPWTLPLREAMVEVLLRLTLLEPPARVPVPTELRPLVARMARTLRRLRAREATVEDAAEATLRLYRILSDLPNEDASSMQWESADISELETETPDQEDAPDEAESELFPDQDSQPEDAEEDGYSSPQAVDYRGDFKPELAQTLAIMRSSQRWGEEQSGLTEELLRALLRKSPEVDPPESLAADTLDPTDDLLSHWQQALEAPSKAPPTAQPAAAGPSSTDKKQEGSLKDEPHTFLYNEWDFLALDYKPRWCRVREMSVIEGATEFYERTLERHAGLVAQVRRQFEMMVPERLKKQKRLPDGEEFDTDAVVEAIVERRAGASPSEKLYWRRNKIDRDVAVVFLLDMSASTAEAIDERPKEPDERRQIPDDPREYLFWLRARREQAKREYRRIIDIEKESAVLLVRALETIGDTYGIYGFSGYGRENVEYYVIKGLEEGFSDAVKRRIDGVSPQHATRMGPAIRHATAKLDGVGTKSKVLFLISDGRPQDREYSHEGTEREYAVQDTHMALLEAKSRNIIPFCLTVDRAGHDYMKAMCGDLPYEVLADVEALPQRLPHLYRRLTV